jgi:hypothetical protein
MVNGHPNLVRIYSYRNLVVTTTILVLSAFASTQLVAKSIPTKMYFSHVSLLASLIKPTKFRPHFIKGSFVNVVTNLAKLFV